MRSLSISSTIFQNHISPTLTAAAALKGLNPGTTMNRSDLLKEIETKDFYEIIQHEINYFYEFIDSNLQREFKEFANRNGKGRSSDFLLLALLIMIVLLVPQSIIQLHFTFEGYYASRSSLMTNVATAVAVIGSISIVSCCFMGWIIFFRENIFGSRFHRNIGGVISNTQSTSLHPEGVGLALNMDTLDIENGFSGKHSISARSFSFRTRIVPDDRTRISSSLKQHSGGGHRGSNMRASFSMQEASSYTQPTTSSATQSMLSNFSSNLDRNEDKVANRYNVSDIMNSLFMFLLQFYFILQFIRFLLDFNCFESESIATTANSQLSIVSYFVANILGNDTCYSQIPHTGFVNAYCLQMFILPFIVFKGLPQTRIKTIWLNFSIAVVAFLTCVFVNGAYRALPSGFVWMLLTYFAIRDFQVRNIIIFLSTRTVQETMATKNKELEESHANEMRSLIANVAHDLKTPLASFTTGLDMIQLTLDEYDASLPADNMAARVMVGSIQQCLTDIRTTNNFMLMTINGCIDYTKVAKGIKLLARPETIDLMETIQLPINCMRNIQSKMKIALLPFNTKAICSHVITDKLWLQENLLCLLSNAVKYSSEGEVTIRLFVKKFDDNDGSEGIICGAGFDNESDVIDQGLTSMTPRSTAPSKSTVGQSSKYLHVGMDCNDRNKVNTTFGSSRTSMPTNAPEVPRRDSMDSYEPSMTSISVRQPRPRMTSIVRTMSHKSLASMNSSIVKDLLVFEIEDTGIRVTDEAMKMLFNPFNQTQRLAGGTGLGLFSLAKRIEALHGKYGVKRRPDGRQGSLFWFATPYRPDPNMAELCATTHFEATSHIDPNRDDNVAQESFLANSISFAPKSSFAMQEVSEPPTTSCAIAEQPEAALNLSIVDDKLQPRCTPTKTVELSPSSDISEAPHRILVVDDSPAILKMASMMLKKLGHSIATAENGQIAVNMVSEASKGGDVEPFAIILMDLQMPVMDGLEAISRIRFLENTRRIENTDPLQTLPSYWIIACSANSDVETQEEAMTAGANRFLCKPYTLADLCTSIAASQL